MAHRQRGCRQGRWAQGLPACAARGKEQDALHVHIQQGSTGCTGCMHTLPGGQEQCTCKHPLSGKISRLQQPLHTRRPGSPPASWCQSSCGSSSRWCTRLAPPTRSPCPRRLCPTAWSERGSGSADVCHAARLSSTAQAPSSLPGVTEPRDDHWRRRSSRPLRR